MFGWAKKLTAIFPSQDCEQDPLTEAETDQEKHTNQDRQSPDNEGENVILESGVSPEKRTPNFVKKLPHLLGISSDGRSLSLRIRSRSKSPRPAITSDHSGRAVTDPPENDNPLNSGISAASSQEKLSNSRTQWYFHSSNELPGKSYVNPEKYVPPDHQDASDRQSTPERYYTPNSSRPTSIKSFNTELSEVNGKSSISEKVLGEVLKGFDKLGDIRSSVFSKETKNSNMKENSKERNAAGGSKSIGSCSSERVGNTNHKGTKPIEVDVMNAQTSKHIQNGNDTGNCRPSNSFANLSGSSPKKEFYNNISKSSLLSQPAVTHKVDFSVSRIEDEKITPVQTQRSSLSAVTALPKTLNDTVFTTGNDSACSVSERSSSELGVSQRKELSAREQHSKLSITQKAKEKSSAFQAKDLLADNNILISPAIVHGIAKDGSNQPNCEGFGDVKMGYQSSADLEIQPSDCNSLEAALLSFEKAVEAFPCSSSSSCQTTSQSSSLPSSDSSEVTSKSAFSSGSKQKFTVHSSLAPSTTCPKDVEQFSNSYLDYLSNDVIHPSSSLNSSSYGNHAISNSQNNPCSITVQSSLPLPSNLCVDEISPAHSCTEGLTKEEIHGVSKDIVVPNSLCDLPRVGAQQEFQSRDLSSLHVDKLINPAKVCPGEQNPTLQPLICSPRHVPRRLGESSHPTQGNQSKEMIQSTDDFKGKSQNGTSLLLSGESNLQSASQLSHPFKCIESKVIPQSPLSHVSQQSDGVQSSLPFHSTHAVDMNKSMLPFKNNEPKDAEKSSLPSSNAEGSTLSPTQSQRCEDHISIPSNGVHLVQASLNSLNSQPRNVSQPTISQLTSELEDGFPSPKGNSHPSLSLAVDNQSEVEKLSTLPTQQIERYKEGFPECNQVKIVDQSPEISLINQSKDGKQSMLILQSGEQKDVNLSLPPTQSYQSNTSQSLLSSQSNETEGVNQPSLTQSHQPNGGTSSPPQSKETELINKSSLSSESCQPDVSQSSLHPQSDGTVAVKHSSSVHQSYQPEGFQSSPIVQSEESKIISQPSPPQSHQPDKSQLPLPSQREEPKSDTSSTPLSQESDGSQPLLMPKSDETQNIQSSLPQSHQPDECQELLTLQSDEPKGISLSLAPQNHLLEGQPSLPSKSDEPESLSLSPPPQSHQPEGSKSTSQSSVPQSPHVDGQLLLSPKSDEPKGISPSLPPQSHPPDGCQAPFPPLCDEYKSTSPSSLQGHQPDGGLAAFPSQSDEAKSVIPSSTLQSHQLDGGQAPFPPLSDESKSISPSSLQGHQPDGGQAAFLSQSDEAKSISPSSLQGHQPDGGLAAFPSQSDEAKSVSPSSLQGHPPDGGQAPFPPLSDESKSISPSSLQGHQPDGGQAPFPPLSDESKSISPSSLQGHQPDGGQAAFLSQSDEAKSISPSSLQGHPPDGVQAPYPSQSDEAKSISPSSLQGHPPDGVQAPFSPLSDEAKSVSPSSPLQNHQPEGGRVPSPPLSDESKSISPSSLQGHQPDGCQAPFPSQSDDPKSISPSPLQSHQLNEGQALFPPLSDEPKSISHSSPLPIHELGEDEPSLPPGGDKPNCVIKKSPVENKALEGEGHSLPPSQKDDLDVVLTSLPSQSDYKLLPVNLSLSSNSQLEQTENIHQPSQLSQNNQKNDSNRSTSSQNNELKNKEQQSPSVSNKQQGATMISLLKDIHLLNKHMHDTVNSTQSSEDRLIDESNLSLSSKINKPSEITPLPLISSPSSHIIRIPQCDFIDSEQGTAQSLDLSASSCYQEKHHIVELVPNPQDTTRQTTLSTTSVTDSAAQAEPPHSFINEENCSKLPLLAGRSDSLHRTIAPLSKPLEVSGNVAPYHSLHITENDNQEVFVDSSDTLQPSKKILTSSCDRFSLQSRSRQNSCNLDNALNSQDIDEGKPHPSENISDKKRCNLLSSSDLQPCNYEVVTPSVQKISEELGKAELSSNTPCNTKVLDNVSGTDIGIKDADLQPHGFENTKQHMIAPPSPKEVAINVTGFVDQNSHAKADGCQPLEAHQSLISEHELQLERNSSITCKTKLVSIIRNPEPLTSNTASLNLCKINDGPSFGEGTSGDLRNVIDNKNIEEKESQNNGQVTKKDTCQKLERDSDNTSSTLLKGNTANKGILPPMAPCQFSHGNASGLTRRVKSQTSLTTGPCDLQPPQAGGNLQLSSRKCFDKNRSASVTRLDEIDKRGNISLVSSTVNSKTPSSRQDGSLPASPLAPRRKRKSDAVPVAQPPIQQPLSGPVKVITKGPSTQQDFKSLAYKVPPRPPAHSNYNVPIAVTPSDVSTPLPDELLNRRIPAEARAPLKTSQKPPLVPKAPMKASLNPFDSEEEEEIEPVLKGKTSLNPFDSEEDEEPEPVSDRAKVETSSKKADKKVSLNPFDSDDDDDDERQEQDSTLQVIPHTKNPLPPPGYNPFDEDEDEEEANNEKSPFSHRYRNTPGQALHTLVSSPYQRRTETLSCNRRPIKPVSLNPFDEEDEDVESSVMAGPFLRISSSHEQSKAAKSLTLKEEASRLSLPYSEPFMKRKKKRPAPLPPGHGSPDEPLAYASSIFPQRQGMYPRVGSSSSLNETPWRNHSRIFGSTLSLFSSKRKPPPRPPPPKWK